MLDDVKAVLSILGVSALIGGVFAVILGVPLLMMAMIAKLLGLL